MSATVTPTSSDIDTVLKAFLESVLPDDMPVIQGQQNRVPEPKALDFAVYTPLRRERLATNLDNTQDVVFTARVINGLMTVVSMRSTSGPIQEQAQLFGAGLAAGTKVLQQNTGSTGGVGTYTIDPPQNIPLETISAGNKSMVQKTRVVTQIDVHGPNSEDNAQIITTAFRDLYAVDFFKAMNPEVVPLYADDPQQIPFVNDQDAYEDRWIIEAHMQADQTVLIPQQFADKVIVTLENVEAEFPA